jgi:hypothetical protein
MQTPLQAAFYQQMTDLALADLESAMHLVEEPGCQMGLLLPLATSGRQAPTTR